MYKIEQVLVGSKKATKFIHDDGTTCTVVNTPTNWLGEVGEQSTDDNYNQAEFNMWTEIYNKEKEKEARILQYLILLQELGVECFHKDGSPMIKTMKKGQITKEDLEELKMKIREIEDTYFTNSTKELDDFAEKAIQPTKSFSSLLIKGEESLRDLKIELLHLILSNISPNELKWINENEKEYPKNHEENLLILIGKILDIVKR